MLRMIQGLTKAEIDIFHREGHVAVDDVLSTGELGPEIEEVTRELTTRASDLVHILR